MGKSNDFIGKSLQLFFPVYKLVSVQMIASLGGDIKLLALSPTLLHTKLAGDVEEPTSLFEKSRGR